jgi:CDP-glycerol glycerophosphotransferase (TagB/SpsB family)
MIVDTKVEIIVIIEIEEMIEEIIENNLKVVIKTDPIVEKEYQTLKKKEINIILIPATTQ